MQTFISRPDHPHPVFWIGRISVSPSTGNHVNTECAPMGPQRIAVAADDAKEATQRQNSAGVDLETLKTTSSEGENVPPLFFHPRTKS